MSRAEQESTARIRRDELTGLLDTMSPTDQQPITARVRISDIQAEAARARGSEPSIEPPKTAKNVKAGKAKAAKVADAAKVVKAFEDQAVVEEVKAVTSPVPVRAKRPSKAPFAQLAALLPSTPAPVRIRAKTNSDATRAPAEQKAVQVIADVRAKLESAEENLTRWDALAERSSFPTLSPQVAAELSGEEIAMLPMEIRLMLPEVQAIQFPRIALTPLPRDVTVGIHSTPCKELGHSIRVSESIEAAARAPSAAWTTVMLLGYFLLACLAGLGAVYVLA